MTPLPLRTKPAKPVLEILKPILYGDIFDYPLTFEEIYRYLEVPAGRTEAREWLAEALACGAVVKAGEYYCLPNRAHLAARRRTRQARAKAMWVEAVRYGRWIAALPFVRLVAVTGALAVDNPRDGLDDVDFLIVTQPGRLWLCRAMITLLVRYTRRRGVHLCPNYLLSETALRLDEINLFTAREMLQMIPLYGRETHQRLWALNQWVTDFLPQGRGVNVERLNDSLPWMDAWLKKVGEWLLSGFPGNRLEQWLQKLQIARHAQRSRRISAADQVIFTADVCKGHYDSHGYKTILAYRQRLEKFGVNGQGVSAISERSPNAPDNGREQ